MRPELDIRDLPSRLEYRVSQSHTRTHLILRRRKQAADLAWKESHSIEDGPSYPQGVYCGEDCVLPLVTMREGHSIVEQVYSQFPDTASESRYDDSPVRSPIITLGLSRD